MYTQYMYTYVHHDDIMMYLLIFFKSLSTILYDDFCVVCFCNFFPSFSTTIYNHELQLLNANYNCNIDDEL